MVLYTTATGGLTTDPSKAVSYSKKTSSSESIPSLSNNASYYDPLQGTGYYKDTSGNVVKVSGRKLVQNSSGNYVGVGEEKKEIVIPVVEKGVIESEGDKITLTDVSAGKQTYAYTGGQALSKYIATYGREGLPFALQRGDIVYQGVTYTAKDGYVIAGNRPVSTREFKGASQEFLRKAGVVDVLYGGNPYEDQKRELKATVEYAPQVEYKEQIGFSSAPNYSKEVPLNYSPANYSSMYQPVLEGKAVYEGYIGKDYEVGYIYSPQNIEVKKRLTGKELFGETIRAIPSGIKSFVSEYGTGLIKAGTVALKTPILYQNAISKIAGFKVNEQSGLIKTPFGYTTGTLQDKDISTFVYTTGAIATFEVGGTFFPTTARVVTRAVGVKGAVDIYTGIKQQDVGKITMGLLEVTPLALEAGSKIYGVGKSYIQKEYTKKWNEALAKDKQLILKDRTELIKMSKDLSLDVRGRPIKSIKGVYVEGIKAGKVKGTGRLIVEEGELQSITPAKVKYDAIKLDISRQKQISLKNTKQGLIELGKSGDVYITDTTQTVKYIKPSKIEGLLSLKQLIFRREISTSTKTTGMIYEKVDIVPTGLEFSKSRSVVVKGTSQAGKTGSINLRIGGNEYKLLGVQYKLTYTPKKISEPFYFEIFDLSSGKGMKLKQEGGTFKTFDISSKDISFGKTTQVQKVEQLVKQKQIYIVKEVVQKPVTKSVILQRQRYKLMQEQVLSPLVTIKPEVKTETRQKTVTELFSRQRQEPTTIQKAIYKPEVIQESRIGIVAISGTKTSTKLAQPTILKSSQSIAQKPAQPTALKPFQPVAQKPTQSIVQSIAQVPTLLIEQRLTESLLSRAEKKPDKTRLPFDFPKLEFKRTSKPVKQKQRGISQTKKYTPTVYSITKGIRGKESKFGELSGFGIRPI